MLHVLLAASATLDSLRLIPPDAPDSYKANAKYARATTQSKCEAVRMTNEPMNEYEDSSMLWPTTTETPTEPAGGCCTMNLLSAHNDQYSESSESTICCGDDECRGPMVVDTLDMSSYICVEPTPSPETAASTDAPGCCYDGYKTNGARVATQSNCEVLTINVGQRGIEMGSKAWVQYCDEHAITKTGENPSMADGGTFQCSEETRTGQCVPRNLMEDLEPNVIAKAMSSMMASQLFGGEPNVDLTNIAPFPRQHFTITVMAAITTQKKKETTNNERRPFTELCFSSEHFFAKVADFDAEDEYYMAVSAN